MIFQRETDETGGLVTSLFIDVGTSVSQVAFVPEPGTTALLATGLVLAGVARPGRARGR